MKLLTDLVLVIVIYMCILLILLYATLKIKKIKEMFFRIKDNSGIDVIKILSLTLYKIEQFGRD